VCTFLKDGNNEYDDGGIHTERIYKILIFGEKVLKKLISFL